MLNLQDILDGQMAKARAKVLETSPQLSIGEMLARLEAADGSLPVEFDFGGAPTTLDSWRGSYEEIAIGFEPKGETLPTAHQLCTDLVFAIGKTYQGYKGGDFTMGRTTPVWVANYGHSWAKDPEDDCRGVVGVRVEVGRVVIETAKCQL